MILTKKKFGVVALVAALGTFLVSAQLSSATHVRPKGATPLYVPLVIAYKNGAPIKLADIATVSDDAENLRQAAWMMGHRF